MDLEETEVRNTLTDQPNAGDCLVWWILFFSNSVTVSPMSRFTSVWFALKLLDRRWDICYISDFRMPVCLNEKCRGRSAAHAYRNPLLMSRAKCDHLDGVSDRKRRPLYVSIVTQWRGKQWRHFKFRFKWFWYSTYQIIHHRSQKYPFFGRGMLSFLSYIIIYCS